MRTPILLLLATLVILPSTARAEGEGGANGGGGSIAAMDHALWQLKAEKVKKELATAIQNDSLKQAFRYLVGSLDPDLILDVITRTTFQRLKAEGLESDILMTTYQPTSRCEDVRTKQRVGLCTKDGERKGTIYFDLDQLALDLSRTSELVASSV